MVRATVQWCESAMVRSPRWCDRPNGMSEQFEWTRSNRRICTSDTPSHRRTVVPRSSRSLALTEVDAGEHQPSTHRRHPAELFAEQRNGKRQRCERLQEEVHACASGAEPRDALLPEPLAECEAGDCQIEQSGHTASG